MNQFMSKPVHDVGGHLGWRGGTNEGGIEHRRRTDPLSRRSISASTLMQGAQDGMVLHGYSTRESASTSALAQFIIHNGQDASTPDVAYVSLLPNESLRELLPTDMNVSSGLFIEWISGQFDLSLWIEQRG